MNLPIRCFVALGLLCAHIGATSAFAAESRAPAPIITSPEDDPRIAMMARKQSSASTPDKAVRNNTMPAAVIPLNVLPNPADQANDPGSHQSWFGFSIGVGDRFTVIGAPRMGVGGMTEVGAAFVYERQGANLVLSARLDPDDPSTDSWFGISVATQDDTVFVGAYRHDDGALPKVGAVYVYRQIDGQWVKTQKLLPPGTPAPHQAFGYSIDVDGPNLAVGAFTSQSQAPMYSGAVHMFQPGVNGWTHYATLGPSTNQQESWFGYSVSLSDDTLLASAIRHDVDGVDAAGRAFVFTTDGAQWSEVASFAPGTPRNAGQFGLNTTLTDGWAAVGYPFSTLDNRGEVHVIGRGITGWASATVQVLTSAGSLPHDIYGWNLAMDENNLWVGRPGFDRPQGFEILRRSGTTWEVASTFEPPGLMWAGNLGREMAISDQGVIVGAPEAHGSSGVRFSVGEVRLFSRTQHITTVAGPGGTFSPSGTHEVAAGVFHSIGVFPSAGHRVVSVTGCDGVLSGKAYQIDPVNQDCTVTGVFANDAPVLTEVLAQSGRYEAEPFSVAVTATDFETIDLMYSFDCDGDGDIDVGPGLASTVQCTIHSAGNHQVRSVVTDEGGLQAQQITPVTILNSIPVIVLVAEDTAEDMQIPLSFTASVPSSGETIARVELDCDYRDNVFTTDRIAPQGIPVPCPPVSVPGPRVIAAIAIDSEEEASLLVTDGMTVTPVNDPPTFLVIGQMTLGPATIGTLTVPGFVSSVSVGPPDEAATQIIESWTVTETSDPNGMVTNAAIDANGTLSFTVNGIGGVATFTLVATDNGGLPGQPQSDPRSFTLTHAFGTDVTVTVQDDRSTVLPGALVEYTIDVGNSGPNATAAQILFEVPVGLANQTWECVVISGGTCPDPAVGTNDIQQTVHLPVGALLRFSAQAEVIASPGAFIDAGALVVPTKGMGEIDATDNAATDTNSVVTIGLFKDGFE